MRRLSEAIAKDALRARGTHTAILLLDGRVLIVGGYGGSVQLASAELYQP